MFWLRLKTTVTSFVVLSVKQYLAGLPLLATNCDESPQSFQNVSKRSLACVRSFVVLSRKESPLRRESFERVQKKFSDKVRLKIVAEQSQSRREPFSI